LDHIFVIEANQKNGSQPHDGDYVRGSQFFCPGGGEMAAGPNIDDVIVAKRSFIAAPGSLNDYAGERAFLIG
jgi:hypothetical protein